MLISVPAMRRKILLALVIPLVVLLSLVALAQPKKGPAVKDPDKKGAPKDDKKIVEADAAAAPAGSSADDLGAPPHKDLPRADDKTSPPR